MSKLQKIEAEDVEAEDIIWFNDKWNFVEKVDFNINGQAVITFDDKITIMVNPKKKFELM